MGARARPRTARDGAQIALRLEAGIAGRLQRRYQRFFADVALASGEVVTAHCPDPGSLRGLLAPDAAVRLSTSPDPRRKLRHTLEMIRSGGTWVSLHPARANAIATLALDHGVLPSLAGYAERRREVAVPGGSRLDFRLAGGDHLHFAILLRGVYVDPVEWWDPKWVREHALGLLETARK